MLVVSELMAKNDQTLADEEGEYDDWIEIHNPASASRSLAGYTLSDSAGDLGKFAFTDDSEIAAGGYLIIWADDTPEQGPLHAPFKLKAGGESAYLAKDGEVVSTMTFGALCVDASYGLGAEGTAGHMQTPTPGAANSDTVDAPPPCPQPEPEPTADGGIIPGADEIVLNEIVAVNVSGLTDENGSPRPWLELFNPSSESQDLTGHALSDSPAQPIGWVFPDSTVIDPGGFLIVFLDGDVVAGPLHSALIARVAGGYAALLSPSYAELTRLNYPALADDVAFGLNAGGDAVHLSTPTPGAANSAPATTSDAGPAASDAGMTDASASDASTIDGGAPDASSGGSDAGN